MTKKTKLVAKPTIDNTLKIRTALHGPWLESADLSQRLKSVLSVNKGQRPNHINEALDRICMKLSRIVIGNSCAIDHWHDIQGYAKLVEIELERRNK